VNIQAINLDIVFTDDMAEITWLRSVANVRFLVDDLYPLAWMGFRLTRPEEFFRYSCLCPSLRVTGRVVG
jgi:hypothetical protein